MLYSSFSYKIQSILFLAFLFISNLGATTQKVLYISSYHASFPSVNKQLAGLKDSLNKDIDIDIEFLDSKRFPSQTDIDRFGAQIAGKLSNIPPYDVIITADDNALRFIKKYSLQLFEKTPVVFMSVNNIALAYEMCSQNSTYTQQSHETAKKPSR